MTISQPHYDQQLINIHREIAVPNSIHCFTAANHAFQTYLVKLSIGLSELML